MKKRISFLVKTAFVVLFSQNIYAQSCVTITEPDPVNAGTGTNASVCSAASGLSVITLNSNLTSEDAGGTWSLAPSSPNPGASFNAASGTFDPNTVANGTYIFRYTVGVSGCDDLEDINVLIQNCCPVKVCAPVKVTRI